MMTSHTFFDYSFNFQSYTDRDIKGSGTEYGKTSMQSKNMRRLGLHRKDQY